MYRKLLIAVIGTLFSSALLAANVCHKIGNITNLIPSATDAGVLTDVALTGCSCDNNVIWIDINTEGGRSMYSAALAAKMANKKVQLTIEDLHGQGTPGNDAITYRFWATCKLMALEILP